MWLTTLACLTVGGLFVWGRRALEDTPAASPCPFPSLLEEHQKSCPAVNVDGTPMLNCHIDVEGKPYGVSSLDGGLDSIDTPWSSSISPSWDTSFDRHSSGSGGWD